MDKKAKHLIILAGANGTGKTTVAAGGKLNFEIMDDNLFNLYKKGK
jgi:predicted ABC-type ATPase